MSRTRNAGLGAITAAAQYAVSLASGFLMFPFVIACLGAYDNGLWLITGEVVGFLLLGDFGIFAVVPYLVATKDGAGDRAACRRYLGDSLMIGTALSLVLAAAAAAVWSSSPAAVGIKPDDFDKVRLPLTLLLALSAAGFPLRAFPAVLSGFQDVVFLGALNVVQPTAAIGLTLGLLLTGFGMTGLAVATATPPILCGVAALVRVLVVHPDLLATFDRPSVTRCRALFVEGLGAWLAGFGWRLQTSVGTLVFGALGQPNWATVYAATGKVVQVALPMCWVVPDSGLIGFSQMLGGGTHTDRTRQTAVCLLLLYMLIPGLAAVALLAANPWFIRVWLGEQLYAGDAVNTLLVLNLVVVSVISGLFKLVAVRGSRLRIGAVTLVQGVCVAAAGYYLGRSNGLEGVALGMVAVSLFFFVPFGLYQFLRTFEVSLRAVLTGGVGLWLLLITPTVVLAAWLGVSVAHQRAWVVVLATGLSCTTYIVLMRPVISAARWPDRVYTYLRRLRLARPRPSIF